MREKGVAHAHFSLPRHGLVLRVPRLSQWALPPPENLAYQAACFGMRHPHLVHRILGMSGLYDIKRLTGGYSDENVYRCNPMDFIPNEQDPDRLAALRQQDVILLIGRGDPQIGNNRDFSGVLWNQGIGNALREWDGWAHDWPYWETMIRMYVGGHD